MKSPLMSITFITLLCMISCCNNLHDALDSAGPNRVELEKVLNHYRLVDRNKEKMLAARYIIENLPAHYSYASNEIYDYYRYAERILDDKSLTPEQQRDSLLIETNLKYRHLTGVTVPDAQIIRSDYLIDNIDKSYNQWKTCPWASQLSFNGYLEWLLPYKATELQELDQWRDTMSAHFGNGLREPVKNDVEYNTTMGVADMLRNEAYNRLKRYGLYTTSGLPLLEASLQVHQTFGNIADYALTSVLIFRSAGIPAVLDETPVGPRNVAATKWYVILSDRGEELASEWDLSTIIGGGFFPYERGPKVFRNTYIINEDRLRYMNRTKYRYPFELAKTDVTSKYFLTSDIQLPLERQQRRKLKDRYVYIASAVRDSVNPWRIVDFGMVKHGKACFKDMGREVLYSVMGYDGTSLVQLTDPFILHKNGIIEYLNTGDINSTDLNKWKNAPL